MWLIYPLHLQMAGTRRNPSGASGSGEEGLPPPPPMPQDLQQVLAMQTELLRNMQQQQRELQQELLRRDGGRRHQQEPLPQAARFEDFLGTHPPIFAKADEPLEADAWIRAIESKFAILAVPCTEERKVVFAAQQLRGAALLWWENHCATLPAGHVVDWEEFRTAFRAHHIPAGLVERKLNEFLALTQGTRTVLQYSQVFNGLCQYAGHHADTDAKKMERFRRGLST